MKKISGIEAHLSADRHESDLGEGPIRQSGRQVNQSVQQNVVWGEFVPCYQPIIRMDTGDVAGYEALARRKDPISGELQAGNFFFDPAIPTTLKRSWDRGVRHKAFEYYASVPGNGFLTVNIFPDWVDMLGNGEIPSLEMIEHSGIDPSRIVMEITERNGDLDNLKKIVRCYQEAGLRVAIDDFGVGASQVDRLIALQPDIIKLDMHLFKSASQGLPEADVLLSVAAIAQRAGCQIICEGVETEDELHFAIECGADYVQGWLFDKAMPQVAEPGVYRQSVAALKKTYLERKKRRHLHLAKQNRAVISEVEKLRALYRNYLGGPLPVAPLNGEALADVGIFRLYVCDTEGDQVSANLDVVEGSVRVSDDLLAYNWSHRPYFPLLHAVNNMNLTHVVASDPYKDHLTGGMCKTYGCFISDSRVLLVDARVNDDVLFQR